MRFFFFTGRVAGRHYPCPTRPVVIPSANPFFGFFWWMV